MRIQRANYRAINNTCYFLINYATSNKLIYYPELYFDDQTRARTLIPFVFIGKMCERFTMISLLGLEKYKEAAS